MQFERWAAFLEQRKQAREANLQKRREAKKSEKHGRQPKIRQGKT